VHDLRWLTVSVWFGDFLTRRTMISKKVQVCTQKDQANTVTPCTGAESDAQPMLSIRLVGASNKVFFPLSSIYYKWSFWLCSWYIKIWSLSVHDTNLFLILCIYHIWLCWEWEKSELIFSYTNLSRHQYGNMLPRPKRYCLVCYMSHLGRM